MSNCKDLSEIRPKDYKSRCVPQKGFVFLDCLLGEISEKLELGSLQDLILWEICQDYEIPRTAA